MIKELSGILFTGFQSRFGQMVHSAMWNKGSTCCSLINIVGNTIHSRPDQILSNKVSDGSLITPLAIPTVYFAVAALVGALLTK